LSRELETRPAAVEMLTFPSQVIVISRSSRKTLHLNRPSLVPLCPAKPHFYFAAPPASPTDLFRGFCLLSRSSQGQCASEARNLDQSSRNTCTSKTKEFLLHHQTPTEMIASKIQTT